MPPAFVYMMGEAMPEFNARDIAPMNDTDASARELPPAARRALQEAQARRAAAQADAEAMPKEIGGRGGEEPTRYGDWEVKGLASDF